MTKDERLKIYAALSAPFPEEAVERTDGLVTGRGYSTTGVKCQYLIDRLNEVLGVGSFRVHRTTSVKETTTARGRPAFEGLCDLRLELGEWIDGRFQVFAETVGDGGHVAMTEADARKGATTSALKRALAMCGPGRDAWRGTLDDDNRPAEDGGRVARERSANPMPARRAAGAPGKRDESGASHVPANSDAASTRARVTGKQVQVIWSLVRERGYEQAAFRRRVRERFGRQLEYLTRAEASEVITMLTSSSAASNGSGHQNQGDDRSVGEAG
jgi:hypothetical protein